MEEGEAGAAAAAAARRAARQEVHDLWVVGNPNRVVQPVTMTPKKVASIQREIRILTEELDTFKHDMKCAHKNKVLMSQLAMDREKAETRLEELESLLGKKNKP